MASTTVRPTLTSTVTSMAFHTLVTRMAGPERRQLDDTNSWIDGSIPSASALATSLGLGTNDNNDQHWIVIPIVCGIAAALIGLSVFLLAVTKKCLGVNKDPIESDNASSGVDQPADHGNSGPNTSSPNQSNVFRLLRLIKPKNRRLDEETPRATEMGQVRSEAWIRLLSPAAYPHAYPAEVHPNPLASNPPTQPEPAKVKSKGILRSNSLKRLSYGIRRVTDPIYNLGNNCNGGGSGDGDLCAYAANLPSGKGHHRGRAVRSEGGRETQLKLQQSNQSDECAIESASECSEDVPEMLPTMPRHRQVEAPRSILKKPTSDAIIRQDLARSSSTRSTRGAAEKKAPIYTPRWAENQEETTEDAGPSMRKGVRFGEDMVRRISVMSTLVDEEDDWITVSSSENSLKGEDVVKEASAVSIQKVGQATKILPRPVLLSSPEPAF